MKYFRLALHSANPLQQLLPRPYTLPCLACVRRCVDLDGNGIICPGEMLQFYEEQMRRLEGLQAEPVVFEDVLCQLHDMLQPKKAGAYTLSDLKRTRCVEMGALTFEIFWQPG